MTWPGRASVCVPFLTTSYAVDEHVGDARGVAVRRLERRRVGDRVRIEDDEVRGVAGLDRCRGSRT